MRGTAQAMRAAASAPQGRDGLQAGDARRIAPLAAALALPAPCWPPACAGRAATLAGRWTPCGPTAGRTREAAATGRRSARRQAGHLLSAAGAATRRRRGEIAGFMLANPGWPGQALLGRRRQEALAARAGRPGRGPGPVRRRMPPQARGALLRLRRCLRAAGRAADAARACDWRGPRASPTRPREPGFLRSLDRAVVTPRTIGDRFDRLVWTEPGGGGAAGGAARSRAAARSRKARLALRRDDPVRALPSSPLWRSRPWTIPGLMLDRARWLRRATGWTRRATLARQRRTARSARRRRSIAAAYWSERNRLARKLLRCGRRQGRLRGGRRAWPDHGASRGSMPSSWPASSRCAGWTNRPRRAALPGAGGGVSRGDHPGPARIYWLGRALAAAASADGAAPLCRGRRMADHLLWPARRAGARRGRRPACRRASAPPPIRAWTREQALDFAGSELSGPPACWPPGASRGAPGLPAAAEELAPDAGERAMAARLATRTRHARHGGRDRRAPGGRDGLMLPGGGLARSADPPPDGRSSRPSRSALIRQESSFDAAGGQPLRRARPDAVACRRTAQKVARQLGAPLVAALTDDPRTTCGSAPPICDELLDRFGGSLPLAFAAYNAGPDRVQEWLGSQRRPARTGAIDMLDWIELIPFGETRNYVQRVMENMVDLPRPAGQSRARACSPPGRQ